MTTNGNNTTASTNASADTQTDAGTLGHLRESASHAYETTRESAATAAARASEGIEANPLAVLAGGVALGAILGALLPKSESEQKVLGPLGKRLSETAAAAATAARDAGKEQLTNAIPDKDAAKESLKKAFGNVVEAAKDGGKTAATGNTNA
ncbi:hypothetical protein [Sphingomonas desiccabilis]|uniref:hypothetical protein n=1 Tax=Sphingomonas desiccabilis TaxID=429134 RepID=UPI0017C34AFE|nr:hypothetical protein [Sphingomonas desiccabilis]MBB3910902.1 ElaB/YqjD/DUF883 family membrane-anchored ribosome-binding protein [Sphingomonas desiccabilis]